MTLLQIDSETILAEALEIARIAAPPFAEQTRGDEVEARLRSIDGWSVRRDAIGNVIAVLGDSTEGAVWAIAHLDTVFAAEQELRFERHGDVVSGPGIGDNALGLAALLSLARELPSQAVNKPLVFVFSVGEEGLGDLRGVRAIVESGVCRSASAVIAIEGHHEDQLGTIAVGSLRYRGVCSGPGGHSWSDRGRPSALHNLIDFSQRLLAIQSQIGGDLAVNIGTLSGGTYVTAIAAEASITFEGRSTVESELQAFEALVRASATSCPLPLTLQEVGRRPAGRLADNHPLVEAVQQARKKAGLPPAKFVARSTDANAFLAAGIPALAIGLTDGRNAHHPTEEINIAPIASGVSALRHLLLDLAR